MSTIEKAPLLETVLEIKWGEVSANKLEFSSQEQTLFSGIVSANASNAGYIFSEPIIGVPNIPHHVTHRFRKDKDTWPCIQTGLGIFTINQLGENYDWDTFKVDIENILDIFKKSNSSNIIQTLNNAKVVLRYQDAFYPNDKEYIDEYLSKHFHISPKLPESFFSNNNIEKNLLNVNMLFEIPLINNLGVIAITIANAIINGKAGLLADIVVQCNLRDISKKDFDISGVMEWLEEAHRIQLHTFKTMIKESAY